VSMAWSWGRRTIRAASCVSHVGGVLAAVCTLALAGCTPDSQAVSIAQPRGATVAFDSLDGLPPAQFQRLVKNLNEEAQARHLAVISRDQPSAYRVRGYLAVKVSKHQTTVTWVWDVFDQEENRSLRISGEETEKVRHRDAWTAADDAMLHRIARASIEQLAVFLTSPEIAPGTAPSPAVDAQVALVGSHESSPEAAGIFRMSGPEIDPILTNTADTVDADTDKATVPRRRPPAGATHTERETLTLTASSR